MLLIDADNSVLCDPSFLFDCPEYTGSGSLFWSDMYSFEAKFVRMYDPWQVRRWPTWLDGWLQDLLDRRLLAPVRAKPHFLPVLRALGVPTNEASGESGQLLIHKTRCRRGLAAVLVMNLNSQRSYVYQGLHCDKDTFPIGFRAVGATFYSTQRQPDLGGRVADDGLFYDSCFIQRAPGADERPVFVHFCGRHRGDERSRLPTSYMAAAGRPFRNWPEDDRRGYLQGTLHPFSAGLTSS